MKTFRLRFNKLEIMFDRDYGLDKKTGWSIAWDHVFLASLETSFWRAIVLAPKRWREWQNSDQQ